MSVRIGSTKGGGRNEVEGENLDIDDCALIISALISFGGNPEKAPPASDSERAWELVEAVERGAGLPALEILERAGH